MAKYTGHYLGGNFKIMISQTPHSFFVATVLYFSSRVGSFAKDKSVTLNTDIVHFFDKTEAGAYNQSIAWIEENLTKDYKIVAED